MIDEIAEKQLSQFQVCLPILRSLVYLDLLSKDWKLNLGERKHNTSFILKDVATRQSAWFVDLGTIMREGVFLHEPLIYDELNQLNQTYLRILRMGQIFLESAALDLCYFNDT